MNELRLLEEIRNDFVSKFDNDPQVKRICNVMINEFKARKKALTLTDVSHQRELLIDFAEKVYRRVFFTWDKKTSEKVVDEYIKGNLQWHNGIV